MPTYSAFIPQGEINETLKAKLIEFILAASRNQPARWPSFAGVFLRNNQPVPVKQGDSYSDYGSEIYMRHNTDSEIPTWVPPVLSCMAQFCQIADEPGIKEAIINIAAKMAADIFRPLRESFIQAPDGIDITTLAINDTTRQVAGVYPPNPEDPEAIPFARLPFSGEIVDVSGSEWHTFTLQS